MNSGLGKNGWWGRLAHDLKLDTNPPAAFTRSSGNAVRGGQETAADRRRGPYVKGLEMGLHRWDSSTMTLTADSKGRIACRDLFPPHASFEALKQPDGRVTLIRLRREARKPRLVKPIFRKGLLVLPMDSAELDSEALDREIREERERENAHLLG